MKRRLSSTLITVLMATFFFALFSIKANASNVNGIAMEPVYPSNQITQNGFLNPRVTPGSTQNLSFNLINLSNETINASISPNTAVTSNTPSIDYGQSKYKYDNSLKYNFRELFETHSEKVKLYPHRPTRITFTAKIPKERFSGILMGAFYIDTGQTFINNSSGTALNNKYTYAMPLVMKEDYSKAIPKLTLDSVKTGEQNKTPTVNSKIYNKRAAAINELNMTTNITDPNGNNIYHNYSNNNSIAPNSNFTYTNLISGKDNLQPGKYHIKIIAISNVGKWVLEKDFNVSVGQYIGTFIHNLSWVWLIIILIILLLLAIIIYIIYRKYKQHKQNEK